MGRHTVSPGAQRPTPRSAGGVGSSGMGLPGRLALGAAALVTVVGAGVLIGPREALANLPWGGPAPCSAETVDIVVAPELVAPVTDITRDVQGRTAVDDHCVAVQVRGQEPQETVASADVLPPDRAPNIWIPDSDVWGQQAELWSPQTKGKLAQTPVVVTTSKAAAEKLGWAEKQPTWDQLMRGKRSVAIPDFRSQSESLDALIALWQSLGAKDEADQAVVAAVVAGDREEVPTPEEALANARSGSSMAALVPATEQAVAVNNASAQPNLVAIYPSEGSPLLDYPVLQIGGQTLSPQRQAAIDLVVRELLSERARGLVRQAGFRDIQGNPPVGQGIDPTQVKRMDPLKTEDVEKMIGRIEAISRPSRILAVLDVSTSMTAKLNDGISRIQLGAAAARMGANLLPDSSYVGAWTFAANMKGGKDYEVTAEVKRLGSITKSGLSWRSHLVRLTQDFNSYLTPGGTALYDTTLDSFKYMHKSYDPKAVNAIILLSDGANEDSGSASLDEVLSTIKRLNDGRKKVQVYTAGLGPDADFQALDAIAKASGGMSYRIDTAGEGQEALLDGLRRSRDFAKLDSTLNPVSN